MPLCELSSLPLRKSFLSANLRPCCCLRESVGGGPGTMWMWVGARLSWGLGPQVQGAWGGLGAQCRMKQGPRHRARRGKGENAGVEAKSLFPSSRLAANGH